MGSSDKEPLKWFVHINIYECIVTGSEFSKMFKMKTNPAGGTQPQNVNAGQLKRLIASLPARRTLPRCIHVVNNHVLSD